MIIYFQEKVTFKASDKGYEGDKDDIVKLFKSNTILHDWDGQVCTVREQKCGLPEENGVEVLDAVHKFSRIEYCSNMSIGCREVYIDVYGK